MARMEPRRLELPGQRVLVIRAMERSDAAGLRALYHNLSEDDTYKRFFSFRPPPDSFIENMASVGERGGFGVVAALAEEAGGGRVLAEASFAPLPDGSGEVGVTVEARARGWLGPYLLDIVVEEARRRGLPNLQAEVLAGNLQMQALLEARGSVVIEHSNCPATVRLCIGTSGRFPAWGEPHEHPRLLVEAPGGRWRSMGAARRAGFQVLACPGVNRKLARCPAIAGTACPLAEGADIIVDALSGETALSLLHAHLELHPGVPVCLDAGARPPGKDGGEPEPGGHGVIYADMDDAARIELLEGMARAVRSM